MLLCLLLCSQIPFLRMETTRDIQIGLGYNVWLYNWSNDSNCVDKPVLGYYNSDDPSVLRSHIRWFDDLGIDFVMVTWQGINNNPYVNQNAHFFFEVLRSCSKHVRACILIEKTGAETNETELCNYIFDEFVVQYPHSYYYYNGKPLIIFFSVGSTIFNASRPLKEDSRFTIVTMGIYEQDDWLYQNINYPEKGFPPNYGGESPRNRQIPVIPRYDDTHITNPPRPSQYCCDPQLTWLFDAEWKRALEAVKNNEVDVITISWWNEYAERTNIEPHYDFTALDKNPFLLYNKAKTYIQIAKRI